ncbi:RNA polymerase sigma factor [Parasediminibacterium sp. JCM 36343]|uniref:RNA polymerase sigma factor n=1 Tax=Parasediminibacterium sp. JCM 36343 TaxID=3374279 RepID=UPI00397D49FA
MPETPANILALIDGCCKNNRNSQRELYYFLHGFAASVCYRYVNQQTDVDELVSESFIKLFKSMERFEAKTGANVELLLKGWFKRIIINTCIDFLRKMHTIIPIQELNYEQDTTLGQEETGLDKVEYKEIIEAIRQLSPSYRSVFNLFVIEGYSHEEIATELGISVGASKSNLNKARNNLRKIINVQNKVAV